MLFGKRIALFSILIAFAAILCSCAETMNAVEHAKLQTQAKMTNTIFLEPARSPDEKTIFVQVKNTSDVPSIQFEHLLKQKLQARGYQIEKAPYKAHYWIQANVLYMGKQSQHATMAGALAGGYGGTLAGLTMGHGYGTLGAAGAGALIGSGLGMIAGAALHVDTYFGVIDVQIKEKSRAPVQTEVRSDLEQGIGTTVHSTQTVNTPYQAYRTRIVASATRTNINLQEAVAVLSDKLAGEIAGIF